MFKQFDIDYDKITIDGVEVKKPSYMSTTQWLEFWEVFDGELVEQKVSIAFDKGYDCRSQEQDKEIEGIKTNCYQEFDNILDEFKDLMENYELDNSEKISEFEKYVKDSRDEIWRL